MLPCLFPSFSLPHAKLKWFMKGFKHKATIEVAVVTAGKKNILWIFSFYLFLKAVILSHCISGYCVIANLLPEKFSDMAFKVNVRYNC